MKKVRFHIDADTGAVDRKIYLIPKLCEHTKEEINSIWWNGNDLAKIETATQFFTSRLRKDRRITRCFTNAMRACEKDPKISFWNSPTAGSEEEEILDERNGNSIFLGLVDWCCQSPSRRGLERYCSFDHYSAREVTVKETIQSVVKLSNKHKRVYFRNQKMTPHQRENNAEEIRMKSEKISLPARNFAYAIGAADAACIKSNVSEPTLSHKKASCFRICFGGNYRKSDNA